MKTQCSLLLGLTLLLVTPLFASTESHQQAAKEMVDVANLDKMVNAMYEHINSSIIQNLLARDPCLEPIKKPLIELLTKYDQRILNANVVKEEIQKVYAQEFTEAEMREIIAFYKTPAGQKALEKAPLLATKGMEIAQKEMEKSRQQGVMTELQNEITKLIENIDPKQLSPECRKQFEERKAKAKTEEKASEKAEAPSSSNKSDKDKTAESGTDKSAGSKPSEKSSGKK